MKKTKDQVQKEAVLAFERNNGNGIIEMATGTGKSKVAINYIAAHPEFQKILLIVPTKKLRDTNWYKEFEKWGRLDDYNKLERSCYVSANKIHNQVYDLVIMDEGHNITENNIKFFEQNVVKHKMVLTATVPKTEVKSDLIRSLNLFPVYTVTLDEAVEWELVSPYSIKIIGVDLNNTDKYIVGGNARKRFFQTEAAAYDYITKQINELSDIDVKTPSVKKRLEMMIFKRLRLIYDLKTKTIAADWLLKNYIPITTRTLIFCGSISQADQLNDYRFHSKTDSEGYDKFVAEEVARLSCVNALNEGHNLPNVDNALVVQLNSKDLNLIQRCGRTVRYRNGHIAEILILVAKNTVDINWARSALKGFDHNNIEYIDFLELKKAIENGNQSEN